MFKKILNTLFTKFFSAVVGFAVIVLVSHLLGAAGKGQQAMIVFNINIILLLMTLMGNSTLVYLTPRKTFSQMFIPSVVWVLSCAALITAAGFLGVFNGGFARFGQSLYFFQTVGISVLASITEINYYVLLGKQQVVKANNLKLVYPLTNAVVISLMWAAGRFSSIGDYVFSLWCAYVLSLFYGIWILKDDYKGLHFLDRKEFRQVSRTLFSLGAVKQLGSIAQTMVYSVSLLLTVYFFGTKGEFYNGIYSNATGICEAVLLFGTSLALVQYSSLSNTQSNVEAKNLTIKLTKVNILFTALALGIVCVLPGSFWMFLFGNDFARVGYYMRILSAGILFLSTSSNITQYFASRGNFSITACASLASLAVTAVAGYVLIPLYNITGAALTAVAAYVTGFTVEFIYFLKWIKRD